MENPRKLHIPTCVCVCIFFSFLIAKQYAVRASNTCVSYQTSLLWNGVLISLRSLWRGCTEVSSEDHFDPNHSHFLKSKMLWWTELKKKWFPLFHFCLWHSQDGILQLSKPKKKIQASLLRTELLIAYFCVCVCVLVYATLCGGPNVPTRIVKPEIFDIVGSLGTSLRSPQGKKK